MNKKYLLKALNNITRSLFPGLLFILITISACKNDPNTIRALTEKGIGQEDKKLRCRGDAYVERIGGSGPISRVLSPAIGQARSQGMAIHLGRRLPAASSDLPGGRPERTAPGNNGLSTALLGHPIWSCTGWGLPCRPRRRERGELLPRLFTLTEPRLAPWL